MTKVAMFRADSGADEIAFRALTARNQAMGRTAGEALDAMNRTVELAARRQWMLLELFP